MKVSGLTDADLDYAVMRCIYPDNSLEFFNSRWPRFFNYSTNWEKGGPIIERDKIKVAPNVGGTWSAQIKHTKSHPLSQKPVLNGWTNSSGPTPLVAAMRCYVASKLGEEIEIPERS